MGVGDLAYLKASYYASMTESRLLKRYYDDSHVFFINGACKNSQVMKGLQEFVTYAQTGEVPDSCANDPTSLAVMVSDRVDGVKQANKSEEDSMTVTEQIRAEGREEERAAMIRNMAEVMCPEDIAKATKLSVEFIKKVLGVAKKSSVGEMHL